MTLNMVVPLKKEECCGCGACADLCHKSAIKIERDEEGFSYPSIDIENCVNYGQCVKNCAFANQKLATLPKNLPNCYVAKHRNDLVRLNSRSGGVFVACSDWILEEKGVVYGCILNQDLVAVHVRAEEKKQRDLMCKSKYVQSDTYKVFTMVESDLMANRKVLFSGTGCQVGGLLSYLKVNKVNIGNLYTLDIVCHGCPSPLLFRDFILWLEKKYNGKVSNFNFRDKSIRGWDGYIESAIISGKKYKGIIWRELFQTDLALRPSCYNCKYATVNHPSDVTIADAWGIRQVMPEFYDNKGASMFLLNGDKGKELLEVIKSSCDVVELPLEGPMFEKNHFTPVKPKGNRDDFWKIYYEGGIELLIKKYAKKKFAYHLKAKLKYFLRKLIYGKKYYLP